MQDATTTIEVFTNKACELATRNRNPSVGPDHLLYVVCSTEEGRREIEKRRGDFRPMLRYLKASFETRANEDRVTEARFSGAFQLIVNTHLIALREGAVSDHSLGGLIDAMIAKSDVCPYLRSAFIHGGLVEEPGTSPEDSAFDKQVADVARSVEMIGTTEAAKTEPADPAEPPAPAEKSAAEGVQGPSARPLQRTADDEGSGSSQHLSVVMSAIRDITHAARKGKIDPIVGRDVEIAQVIDILQKRRKANILLVGEPGVGKTALVEGVARILVESQTPASVVTRPLLEVSMADLVAGARFRGDFEARVRLLVTYATQKRAILFFDEAHMMVGAGSASGSGSMDAANILKPALARGDIMTIAATTPTELRQLRKDRALMRRFEIIRLKEPRPEDVRNMIAGMTRTYEDHHGIGYAPDALDRTVELARTRIPERHFPDKAFDVMDIAAIVAKNDGADQVLPEHVDAAVSRITGITVGRPRPADIENARLFGDRMRQRIHGQDDAIARLVKSVRLSALGLTPGGVAGSYLFNGPTGVGKTETAQAMADALGIPLVRIDMSEYMEKHSISGLIGAPPGYVGYDDEGVLIAAAETHPRMVLLLDEVEKAHPEVFDILLQVLDAGRLTSSDGRTVSFRGAHVILTANIGAAEAERASIGFGRTTNKAETAQNEVSRTFRKEFLARIRTRIHFQELGRSVVEHIVQTEIAKVCARLMEAEIEVRVTPDVSDLITDQTAGPGASGRSVEDAVVRLFSDRISEAVLDEFPDGPLHAVVENGQVVIYRIAH